MHASNVLPQKVAGARTVPIETGGMYTDAQWSQTLMPLAEFIRKHVAQVRFRIQNENVL
jgi:hypothetical protein